MQIHWYLLNRNLLLNNFSLNLNEEVAVIRLAPDELRELLHQAHLDEVLEDLIHAGYDVSVAHRHEDVVFKAARQTMIDILDAVALSNHMFDEIG